MMGCAESHIRLLKGAVDRGEDLIVFEDDCEILLTADGVMFALEHMREVIQTVNGGEWDILLLGANEYVDSQPVTPLISRISRFWGTHAMLIRSRAAREVLRVFVETQKEGVFYPADWLYNEAIKRRGLAVFAPTNPRAFCRQIPGLRSDVTGGVRS
jgi:GR25 family glycosyltransferase involved in LPS biosynthesis